MLPEKQTHLLADHLNVRRSSREREGEQEIALADDEF